MNTANFLPGSRLQNRPTKGFTLVELLIVMTILSILLAVGVPSFQSFILGQRVKTAAYDVHAALTFARSEAIKRNANVVITPAGTGWKDGWTITTAAGATIGTQAAYTNLTFSGPNAITYGNDGRLTTAITPIEISTSPASRCATITVNISGLPNNKVVFC